MSDSDDDNDRDEWFLNDWLFYYKLQCKPIANGSYMYPHLYTCISVVDCVNMNVSYIWY